MFPTTNDATANDRPLRPVANDATDASGTPPVTAETKVHGALHGNPGATTTELAKAAGVGRSTAAKILARWAVEGVLIRTAGKDQRTPDTWTIPDTTNDTENDQTADNGIAATNEDDAPAKPGPSDIAETPGDARTPPEALQSLEADSVSVDSTSEQSQTATELAPLPTSAPVDAAEEPDAVPRDITTGDAVPDPVDPGDEPAVDAASDDGPAVPTTGAQKDRLPKGGLYELVKAYLAEHPGDSFGPAKIGTDLGRSSGAVSNALDKLVVDGHAAKTCEAPKRFAVKSGSADAE